MNSGDGSMAKNLLTGAVGVILFLVLWQVIGAYRLAGMGWPTLTSVLDVLATPSRFGTFQRAVTATVRSVLLGYVAGFVMGFGFALLGHLWPGLKVGTDQTTAVIHAIPAIALAPLLIVFFGLAATPIAICALNVFFLVYNATSSGLLSVNNTHRDLFTAYGANRYDRFRWLELPAALPSIAAGLKLAVPAALIGTILGEWFGAPQGVGLLMIAAMQNFQISMLWSAVLLSVAISLSMMALTSLIEHYVSHRFG